MTISAIRPVRSTDRIIDADTTNLTAIPRPRPSAEQVDRFPINSAYRRRNLDRAAQAFGLATAPGATLPAVAALLGVTPGDAHQLCLNFIAGQPDWTAEQRRVAAASLPADPELCPAWCTARGQDHHDGAEPLHSRTLLDLLSGDGAVVNERVNIRLNLEQVEAPELPGGVDPALAILEMVSSDGQMGASASLMLDQAGRLGRALVAAEHLGTAPSAPRAGRPADCPPWCATDHTGELAEVDGFSIGAGHERRLAELTAADGVSLDDPATATVLVESCTEQGRVTMPARVLLSVCEGSEGAYAGGEGVQGWAGTPDQAEALAAALLAAAATARVSR
ncbi:hypothetical protein ACN267_32215 [Micromonospora sp. WMMD734]|uniref:hypothetical protein n=1 Tax=Micromonospora sp. WMMD734 TaxID=3404129 RepID=UPI003B92D925